MNFLKRISSNSTVKRFISYYSFTIINSIIAFFSISFLTKNIAPVDYGYIGIYNSIIYFMPSLITFSSLGLSGINIVDLETDKYIYFRNCFISFVLISFTVYLIIGIFVALIFPTLLFLLIVVLFDSLFIVLITIHMTELVQQKKALLWGILSSVTSILVFASTILFVGYFEMGWKGRLLSIVIIDFILVIVRFTRFSDIISKFHFNFDKNQIRSYLKYGWPILISLGASFLILNSDRYVLLYFFSMKEVGLYTASSGIASIIVTLNSVVVKVFVPDIYQALKEKRGYRKIRRINILYSIIVIIVALLISIISFNLLDLVFGEKYSSTAPIISIMCFSQAFFGVYTANGLILDYYKLNKLKTSIFWACAILSISISLGLIKFVGFYAPALGTMSGFLLLAILTYIYAKKYIKINNIAD